MIPWVPEAFQALFPDSVKVKKCLLVSTSEGRRSSLSHVRKNLWYPEKADEETES